MLSAWKGVAPSLLLLNTTFWKHDLTRKDSEEQLEIETALGLLGHLTSNHQTSTVIQYSLYKSMCCIKRSHSELHYITQKGTRSFWYQTLRSLILLRTITAYFTKHRPSQKRLITSLFRILFSIRKTCLSHELLPRERKKGLKVFSKEDLSVRLM